LEYYEESGVKTLAIMDDNLLSMGARRVNEVMQLVNSFDFNIEYGNGLELKALLRHWDAVHEEVLKNCTVLYAPLEDLTQDTFYSKLEPIERELALIDRVVGYFDGQSDSRQRYVTMGVILGVPGHTKEGLFENVPNNVQRFLELFVGSQVKTAVTAFNFMPLVGTSFGDEALRSGRLLVDIVREHPEVVNFETVSYAPKGMTGGDVFEAYKNLINMNPAGRVDSSGKSLGLRYEDLKHLGEKALPEDQRDKIPSHWREPGKEFTEGMVAGAGIHYKAPVTEEIIEDNKK